MMFPERQRRQMPSHPFMPPRQNLREQPHSTKSNLMSYIQDSEGNLDFERITKTFHQINQIYHQVSPMISKFKRK